jgi:hypothetical protein
MPLLILAATTGKRDDVAATTDAIERVSRARRIWARRGGL